MNFYLFPYIWKKQVISILLSWTCIFLEFYSKQVTCYSVSIFLEFYSKQVTFHSVSIFLEFYSKQVTCCSVSFNVI